MKANELRIGNLVFNDYLKVNKYIVGIFDNEIWLSNTDELNQNQRSNVESINGIPLTEQILLKCGFESYKTYLLRKKINDDFYLIFSPKDTRPLYCILRMYNDDMDMLQECNNIVDCNYLHQLQNIYFALTGEELELKQ